MSQSPYHTKHTPGPWHVGMRPGPIVYGPKGEQVALPDVLFLDREEGEANARLIASAPSLLEALKELLADISELSDEFSICQEILDSSYGDKAVAAIAKAEGSGVPRV